LPDFPSNKKGARIHKNIHSFALGRRGEKAVLTFRIINIAKFIYKVGRNAFGSIISEGMRQLFGSFLAVFLFGLHLLLSAGLFMGIMVIPLLPYIWRMILSANETFAAGFIFYLYVALFGIEFWIGRLIIFTGIAILFISLFQLLLSKRRGNKIVKSGLYSKMRHPQFTGILLITFGISVLVATMGRYFGTGKFEIMSYWLLSTFGYIAIAKFEESRLTKKLDAFRQYKKEVPFLFPIKPSKRVPEMLITILIVGLLWIVLLFAPFSNLPLFGFRVTPTIALSPFVLGLAITTWIAPFLVAALVYLKKSRQRFPRNLISKP
jgi:protein-S-isoprenylcysteine O-methyltransferase Ste14